MCLCVCPAREMSHQSVWRVFALGPISISSAEEQPDEEDDGARHHV